MLSAAMRCSHGMARGSFGPAEGPGARQHHPWSSAGKQARSRNPSKLSPTSVECPPRASAYVHTRAHTHARSAFGCWCRLPRTSYNHHTPPPSRLTGAVLVPSPPSLDLVVLGELVVVKRERIAEIERVPPRDADQQQHILVLSLRSGQWGWAVGRRLYLQIIRGCERYTRHTSRHSGHVTLIHAHCGAGSNRSQRRFLIVLIVLSAGAYHLPLPLYEVTLGGGRGGVGLVIAHSYMVKGGRIGGFGGG
eukprot:scaffold24708_cov67-Phaeocystis_antarctica.AAC.3